MPCSIGVVICSHQRPDRLDRCLAALAAQRRRPDEVIVVVRDTDARTQAYLRDWAGDLAIRAVTVAAPGLIAARAAGFAASASDIIAMTDDDAMPSDEWIARITAHFAADPGIGGVGGRDRCHDGLRFDDRRRKTVGKVQWFGRVIGNHHLGCGPARDVDLLKGANMSFRREAVETRGRGLRGCGLLRGEGAQPHEDAALSWAVRRAGWRLVYDPQILVEHFVAEREEVRHYASRGEIGDGKAFFDHCFNLVVAIWGRLPWHRRLVYVLWSGLIGTSASPGIIQAIRYTPAMGTNAWRRFWIAQRAQIAAYREILRQKRTATANLVRLPPGPAWRWGR